MTGHFLIIYDRPNGNLRRCERFDDSKAALRARFTAEVTHGHRPDYEIVVLSGDSLDAIKRTHSRYFGINVTRRADTTTAGESL